MRKLALVSLVLVFTWVALGQPSLAADKPGIVKSGKTMFVQGPDKLAGGSCFVTCDWENWEYGGEVGTAYDCACVCSERCGTGCIGWEGNDPPSAYCDVSAS